MAACVACAESAAMTGTVDRLQAALERGAAAYRDIREFRRLAGRLIVAEHIDHRRVLGDLLRWRLSWESRDLDYCPRGVGPPNLIPARAATRLIRDGDTVISSGFASSGRCSIFFWAVREAFERLGRPRGLTWITVSAQGGRGRLPGTIEELALPGLLSRYICGHLETARALLALADEGRLELHTMPQGVMTALLEMQGRGKRSVSSTTGAGTFLDPRCGRGSALTPGARMALVRPRGDRLRYTLPGIDVAFLSAPHADRQGNLYYHDAPTISENSEVARAARRNGGKVVAVVGDIIASDPARISLPARYVDHIVLNPHQEQIGGVLQSSCWPMFSPGARVDVDGSLALVRFVNTVSGAVARRGELERAVARMAARVFLDNTPEGALVNIGVGMPEELCMLLYETGMHDKFRFSTEAGVIGGVPTPGVFFGAAIAPERIESSAAVFRRYRRSLQTTVLGFLEVDSAGNVNVSRRGAAMSDYIGPGGFCDIADSARTLIFVGSWMVGGRMSLKDGRLRILDRGRCKFVRAVREVTFNGAQALAAGKRIYYVSNVGIFRLSPRGLTLTHIAPGVDLQRDVLDASGARIHVDRRRLKTLSPSLGDARPA
jgi:propionate CoA-transferase